MSWRTVLITKRAKLDLRLGYLVVRKENEATKIHINEISNLIIESPEVSLTVALLAELVKLKVKVIFCDEKRNPVSELVGYTGSYDTSGKIREQIGWTSASKVAIWTEIVISKIRNQAQVLKAFRREQFSLLEQYISEIELNDVTNREGHAAKVYFNALFGNDFSRSETNPINAALNYGYSFLLSTCNREIVANGYITQIGIFHDNVHNPYNLGSDLMEPFRPFIDMFVYRLLLKNELEDFTTVEKHKMYLVLQEEVMMEGKKYHLDYALKLYCHSVFDALADNEYDRLKFPSFVM